MRRISLTQGQFALVDDDDFARLNRYKWQAQKRPKGFYATRTHTFIGLRVFRNGKYHDRQVKVSMARCILGLCSEDKRAVNHINHNTLDNRRSELKVCMKQPRKAS